MSVTKVAGCKRSSSHSEATVKRPYVPPQLKEYGSLADLTRGQLGRYPEGFNNSYKGPTF